MRKTYIIGIVLFIQIMILAIFPVSADANSTNTSNGTIGDKTIRIPANPTEYRFFVDEYKGFYRIINMSNGELVNNDNRNITIYAGDTITWISDDPSSALTVVSKDRLWTNRTAYLRWQDKRFNYTFYKSGTYEFYIRQAPEIQHQIILVKKIKLIRIINQSNEVKLRNGLSDNVQTNNVQTNIIKKIRFTRLQADVKGDNIQKADGFGIISVITVVLSLYLLKNLKKRN